MWKEGAHVMTRLPRCPRTRPRDSAIQRAAHEYGDATSVHLSALPTCCACLCIGFCAPRTCYHGHICKPSSPVSQSLAFDRLSSNLRFSPVIELLVTPRTPSPRHWLTGRRQMATKQSPPSLTAEWGHMTPRLPSRRNLSCCCPA